MSTTSPTPRKSHTETTHATAGNQTESRRRRQTRFCGVLMASTILRHPDASRQAPPAAAGPLLGLRKTLMFSPIHPRFSVISAAAETALSPPPFSRPHRPRREHQNPRPQHRRRERPEQRIAHRRHQQHDGDAFEHVTVLRRDASMGCGFSHKGAGTRLLRGAEGKRTARRGGPSQTRMGWRGTRDGGRPRVPGGGIASERGRGPRTPRTRKTRAGQRASVSQRVRKVERIWSASWR